ncbi:molybdopterin synthase sulfur carrier subunit [Methanocella sp. CWC-04]|uniref:Molybdopterin synthase sulfur carrier subunit n=1 Tax=Methanooceanicella nereidis TaxID=2052831 RepID=A0AAP2RCN3_9EURY|nr:ubiquitin-like small modifier protein 1 [Methanocella sp. CWC-04]MCD1294834.1 molybdopterin synthase sulfur carrier subunit [Methanocella sp. CWC-04]
MATVTVKIKIKLFANFREVTRKKDIEIDVAGDTIRDVISSLISEYPGLGPLMLQDGEIKPYVNVLLNGKDVKSGKGMAAQIKEGDELAIFPPVSGG